MTTPEQSPATGRRFHLQELVGEGAFGEVFLAEQDSGAGFTRRVALKLLHGHLERSEEVGKRMRDEARILGRLQHKNIVTVLDLLHLEDRWAIVMDYVPGADLAEVIDELNERGEAFPAPAAFEVGTAIYEALGFAFHFENTAGKPLHVVHRDIKPSNVRLSADGQPKVLDFGVARVELEDREAMTKKPMWLGTERYMAPERILRERDDEAGDIYAAAATIVELLLGEPFGRTPVLADRHAAKVAETRVLLDTKVFGDEDLKARVLDALMEALAAEPDDRPSHAEMEEVLREGARKLEGEALLPLTRRVVPDIERQQKSRRKQVSGSLVAGTLASTGSVVSDAIDVKDGSTWDPDKSPPLGKPALEQAPEMAEEGKSRGGLVMGVAAVGALFGVAVLALMSGGLWFAFAPSTTASPVDVGPTELVPAGTVRPAPEPENIVQAVEPQGVTVGDASAEASTDDAQEATSDGAADEPPGNTNAAEPTASEPTASEPFVAKPVKAGTGSAPTTQPEASTDAPVAEADPNAPIIRRAIVNLKDASAIEVRCGSVVATGTGTASIRSFPAGTCTVKATYLGQAVQGTIKITRPTEVVCTVVNGGLSCR